MATYNIDNLPAQLNPGDIINCPYSGTEKTLRLPPGKYRLQCWGGMGGGSETALYDTDGGIGGYSVGDMLICNHKNIYINCGGQGDNVEERSSISTITYPGGYNGGGQGMHVYVAAHGNFGCGGGATHIAFASGLLSSLSDNRESVIIVAGGGGGGNAQGVLYSGNGYRGGGESGESGPSSTSGKGGTQTEGGDADASFGKGGTTGGGGWYGGGMGGVGNNPGGGGGSGHVNTSILTDASTNIESTSTNPGGGQGYVRITVIEAFDSKAIIFGKKSGQWVFGTNNSVKKNGQWHAIEAFYEKQNGSWVKWE